MSKLTTGISRFKSCLRAFSADSRGATAIEYSILISMIIVALVGISSLTGVAQNLNDTFNYAAGYMK